MIKATDQPVIIVGGGIGGLAAALALALQGIRSVLLEQSAEFREVGAGIQLGPNVFRRFEALGIRKAIEAIAVFPDNLIMRDAHDQVVGENGEDRKSTRLNSSH